jgi:hypothetical protein
MDASTAQQILNQGHASCFGLAFPFLSPAWSSALPTFDASTLTLSFTNPNAPILVPIGGHVVYRYTSDQTLPHGAPEVSGLDGRPVTGDVALLEVHPQAYLRLEQLYVSRYGGGGGRSLRPVPRYFVVRLSQRTTPRPGLSLARAGDATSWIGTASFHDERGLIIDPLAVAAVFADILGALSNLSAPNVAGPTLSSLVSTLGSNTPSVSLHLVTPHGAPWSDSAQQLQVSAQGGTTQVSGAGPYDLSGGNASLSAVNLNAANFSLRWGWATNGTLGTAPFTVAATNLARDFVRVCVVDLARHLVGDRSAAPAGEPVPPLRVGSSIRFHRDGIDLLNRLNAIMPVLQQQTNGMWLAVSPTIDDQFTVPGARWPSVPRAGNTPGTWAATTSTTTPTQRLHSDPTVLSAAWAPNSNDVVLTIAAGIIPVEAHVRVYPRRFVTGPSLRTSPTLFRGDGAATIAPASGTPTVLGLPDPLGLGPRPQPSDAVLHFDLLVAPRPATGRTRPRLFGGLTVRVSGTGSSPTAVVESANGIVSAGSLYRGLCSSPLLGLPPPPGPRPSFNLGSLATLVRALASDRPPREAPRFPTMARYESLAAAATIANGRYVWQTLVTGGFLTRDSRTGDYRLGNPGFTAGAESHVTGVSVDGELGYDVSLAALRRARPVLPIPPTQLDASNSRLPNLIDSKWQFPGDATASITVAPGNLTTAGAILQTVAPYCETPEFAAYDGDLTDFPKTWAEAQAKLPPLKNVSLTNGDAAIAELRREFYAARYGRRDAQWAMRRAISDARELVYIEAPQLCFTAYGTTQQPYSWDLVTTLAQRLVDEPNLRVVIALNKVPSFGAQYQGWAKQALNARLDAITRLRAAAAVSGDPGRVTAFHPIGFSGRPLNIRTTVVIVDDVWCLVGTSVPRRRGFTFDGASDLVAFDLALQGGYATAIQSFRQQLMALHVGAVAQPQGTMPDQAWIRLAQPASAARLYAELLAQGGRGLIEPLWDGAANEALPQSNDVADPEGRDVSALLALGVSALADLETAPT